MATFLHTMVRITDPERSRRFYEALGFRFDRDMDIVRNGELEATNYFFSLGDHESVLELTYNHDGRTYELGTSRPNLAASSTRSTSAPTMTTGATRNALVRRKCGGCVNSSDLNKSGPQSASNSGSTS
jgi:catechol 2,3-dioxygenase-like lactoylglutathione lyase family enzyme